MVSPSRNRSSVRGREDAGKLFLGALVLLGVVASVFLVFSDSVELIRIGLVVALWAAVLGAWAVNRYQATVSDLRNTYERELEHEISARREYELGVESRVRAEVGADATEMAALRVELAVLRQNLQRLFDGELPADRPALRAAAFRVQELSGAQDRLDLPSVLPTTSEPGERGAVDAWANVAASWSEAADGWVDSASGTVEVDSGAATPVYDSDHPSRPRFASPDDAPVTAETAIVRLDDDAPHTGAAPDIPGPSWSDAFTEVHEQADGGELYGPPTRGQVVQGPPRHSEVLPKPEAPEELAQAPGASVPGPAKASGPATPRERVGRAAAKLSPRSVSPRRRRVPADQSGSRRLSVAEIMANLRKEEEQRSP